MPTVKPERARAAAKRWKARGYRMAFFQNSGTSGADVVREDITDISVCGIYNGVWNAINHLADLAVDCGTDVCVFAGDDMDPDPNHTAEEIAHEYLERFPLGDGVMQPSGDPQGMDGSGLPAAGRICGSAWFGRGWVERAYGGRGPTFPDYWHFYSDEELALVAERLGKMWWRPDLVQMHKHWSWGHTEKQDYHDRNQTQWDTDKALFEKRRAAGFPESEMRQPSEGVAYAP
jgi:hypothetical protein